MIDFPICLASTTLPHTLHNQPRTIYRHQEPRQHIVMENIFEFLEVGAPPHGLTPSAGNDQQTRL